MNERAEQALGELMSSKKYKQVLEVPAQPQEDEDGI